MYGGFVFTNAADSDCVQGMLSSAYRIDQVFMGSVTSCIHQRTL